MRRKLENGCYLLIRCEVIPAKVPILRVFLRIQSSEIQCDVNVDNLIGIRNSWLLRCYSELDQRVRPFIYIVKKFAKAANLNDASQGTMSTYSWLLLAMNFLQTGVEPAVLPIVHTMTAPDGRKYGDKFTKDCLVDVSEVALAVKEESQFKSENTMSVGELFYKWLVYYSLSFNY